MGWERKIYWPGVLSVFGGGIAGVGIFYCCIWFHPLIALVAFLLSFIPPALGHLLGHYINDWLGVNSPERIAAWLKKQQESTGDAP